MITEWPREGICSGFFFKPEASARTLKGEKRDHTLKSEKRDGLRYFEFFEVCQRESLEVQREESYSSLGVKGQMGK